MSLEADKHDLAAAASWVLVDMCGRGTEPETTWVQAPETGIDLPTLAHFAEVWHLGAPDFTSHDATIVTVSHVTTTDHGKTFTMELSMRYWSSSSLFTGFIRDRWDFMVKRSGDSWRTVNANFMGIWREVGSTLQRGY